MSTYFAIDRAAIDYPKCFTSEEQQLAAGYDFLALSGDQVPSSLIQQWEELRGKKWKIHANSWVMFILKNDKVVSTMYVTHKDNIGTFHAAFTLLEHRYNGFYKYFLYNGMGYLIEQGVSRFEVDTDKEHLWRVWRRLAFEQVDMVNKITKG